MVPIYYIFFFRLSTRPGNFDNSLNVDLPGTYRRITKDCLELHARALGATHLELYLAIGYALLIPITHNSYGRDVFFRFHITDSFNPP